MLSFRIQIFFLIKLFFHVSEPIHPQGGSWDVLNNLRKKEAREKYGQEDFKSKHGYSLGAEESSKQQNDKKKQKQRHHLLLHCDDEFQTKAFESRHLIIWKCLSLLSQCTNKNAKLQLLTVNMNAIDAQQINVLLVEMRYSYEITQSSQFQQCIPSLDSPSKKAQYPRYVCIKNTQRPSSEKFFSLLDVLMIFTDWLYGR